MLIKIAKIKNSYTTKCWQGCVKTGLPINWYVNLNGATTLDNSLQFILKLKMDLPYNRAIALLGIFPREIKTYFHVQMCARFIGALFITAKTWKSPKFPSMDE